jgi:hypothetical protein
MSNYIVISLCILFFALAHFFVNLGIFFRIAGGCSKAPYIAHSIEKFFQLVSTACLAVFTPSLAFITEAVFSTKNYILLVCISQLFAFFLVGFLLICRDSILSWALLLIDISIHDRHFYLRVFSSFVGNIDLFISKIFNYRKFSGRFFLIGFLISFFSGSGFFTAFFLASIYPDYRLTLSQSAIIIHGVGIVLQSLYADPALARIQETKSSSDWQNFFISYLLGRCLAFFAAAVISGAAYLSIHT